MSYYGGDFFGGEFEFSSIVSSGPFFNGPFFGGGFFEETEPQEEPIRTRPDDGGKRRRIFKPTGLPPIGRKTVAQRVEDTRQIAREVREEFVEVEEPTPVKQMSIVDIEAEIGELLRKKLRTEDEEIMLLLLLVASA